ncbi:MlaA family lipoprotein [Aquabacterium sp. UBA2148]|uniref:MlaA family lipoprotein n=1 Tax=Aquabacterium sp. UBA2148 TaxID=1946042 RepID=UPI0025803E7B|nr:VacJ family lipoprotein [Aquabacterium sp. UBA2148]
MINRFAMRRSAVVVALVCASLLQGCATRQQPDPFENLNREVFAFNETVDENVLQPVARGYVNVTPEPVRIGVRNFFNNLRDVWSTVNLFLQGRFGEGATAIMRVSMNTTFGLAGLIDIATPMRLERPNEDLGQTLGVWGMGPGAYIVWPFLGPSTARDSFDIPPTFAFGGTMLADGWKAELAITGVNLISLRADLLAAGDLVNDIALDKYAFIRDAYLQRRQNLIHNGEPPDADDDEEEPFVDESKEPEAPAAGSPGASVLPVGLPESALATVVAGPALTAPANVSVHRVMLSVADPEWAFSPAFAEVASAGTATADASRVNTGEVLRQGLPEPVLAR